MYSRAAPQEGVSVTAAQAVSLCPASPPGESSDSQHTPGAKLGLEHQLLLLVPNHSLQMQSFGF